MALWLHVLSILAFFDAPTPDAPPAGEASDVRYIKCEVCEAAVTAAHEQFAALKATSKAPVSEEAAQNILEYLCNPSLDESKWMRAIDLVEQEAHDGGRRLAVVKMKQEGPCDTECGTVALACKASMEGMETELGEALYTGTRDAAALRTHACREWSGACRRPPPKLDPARPDGPTFRPYTLEELYRVWQRSGSPALPGVLGEEQLRVRMGLAPDSSTFAPPPRVEDSPPGAAAGRGEQLGRLEHSAAFEAEA